MFAGLSCGGVDTKYIYIYIYIYQFREVSVWLGFDSHEAVYFLLLRGTCSRSAESYDSVCTLLCIIDGRWQTLANVHLLVWHAFPLALPWLQRTPTQEGEKAGSADGEDLVPCQSIRCTDGECIPF